MRLLRLWFRLGIARLVEQVQRLDRRQDRLQSDSQRRTLSDFWVAPFRKERLVKLALRRRPIIERSTLPEWHRPATARRSHSVGGLCARLYKRARAVTSFGEPGPSAFGQRSAGAERRSPVHVHSDSYLVDPASSHMLVSKTKPCMSKYKRFYTVKLRNGSLNQL